MLDAEDDRRVIVAGKADGHKRICMNIDWAHSRRSTTCMSDRALIMQALLYLSTLVIHTAEPRPSSASFSSECDMHPGMLAVGKRVLVMFAVGSENSV